MIAGNSFGGRRNLAAFLRFKGRVAEVAASGNEPGNIDNFVRFSQKTFILHLYSGFLQLH